MTWLLTWLNVSVATLNATLYLLVIYRFGHLQIGCYNRIEPPTLPKQFCSFTMDIYISLAIHNLKVCLLIYTYKCRALAQMQKRLECKES